VAAANAPAPLARSRADTTLEVAREFSVANSLDEVMRAARTAVRAHTRYQQAWLSLFDRDGAHVRIIAIEGGIAQRVWAWSAAMPTERDRFLAELLQATSPVIIVDARVDPRTDKARVGLLGNRTIVNIPVQFSREQRGAFGVGSFGDEGVIAPTESELELLALISVLTAQAVNRVQQASRELGLLEQQQHLRARIDRVARIEALALLSGGVAHDYNNLLTIIMSSLHFVQEAQLSAQQTEDLDAALEAAERARALTQQLLALGHDRPLRLAPTQVKELFRSLDRLLRRLLRDRVTLTVKHEPGLPELLADGGQLEQVLLNLALNARDAMPEGGDLTIEARLDGTTLVLSVTDTGVGISPEVRSRIFEPFFTTKSPGHGTGLGLAVVARVVDHHGGTVHCDSTPGKGTTFTLRLPVRLPSDTEEAAAPVGPPAPGSERVLLAEEDDAVRGLMARVLRDVGYDVTQAADGHDALRAAQLGRFDLALVDPLLPTSGNSRLGHQLRELQPSGQLLLTQVDPGENPEATVLEKPFTPDELLRAVRHALARRAP
jgi:signal transduction histidine kinase/CheY-like chemotaxis protein